MSNDSRSESASCDEIRFVRTEKDFGPALSGLGLWRKRLRAVVIRLLYPLVWLSYRSRSRRRSLRVVLYHNILDDQVDSFRRHMEYLSREFEFVDIDRFLDLLSGKEELAGKSKLLVTFDDGFKNNLTNALPVLEFFGVKAVFFVTTDFISLSKEDVEEHRRFGRDVFHSGRPVENMSWEDVAFLMDRGHTIGAHTLDHVNLTSLSPDDLARQIEEPRHVLEEKLGRPAVDFSFPYGRMQECPGGLSEMTKDAGFRTCFNMIRGINLPGQNPHFINRDAFDAGWPLVQLKFFMMRSPVPASKGTAESGLS